jgi:putative endonuclease
MDKQFFVYIITNKTNTVLYTGFTSSFDQTTSQPKNPIMKLPCSYNADRLVYFEAFKNAYEAVLRGKQLEEYSRRQQIDLIESVNPKWTDLRDRIPQLD